MDHSLHERMEPWHSASVWFWRESLNKHNSSWVLLFGESSCARVGKGAMYVCSPQYSNRFWRFRPAFPLLARVNRVRFSYMYLLNQDQFGREVARCRSGANYLRKGILRTLPLSPSGSAEAWEVMSRWVLLIERRFVMRSVRSAAKINFHIIIPITDVVIFSL